MSLVVNIEDEECDSERVVEQGVGWENGERVWG